MKKKTVTIKQILALITFYAKTGFSGMTIVPFLLILSAALYICAFLVLTAGLITTIGTLPDFDFPSLVLNMGFRSAPNVLALPTYCAVCLLASSIYRVTVCGTV